MSNDPTAVSIWEEWISASSLADWSSWEKELQDPFFSASKNADEHLAKLKKAWAHLILTGVLPDVPSIKGLCVHPLAKVYAVGRVLSYLLAKQIREPLVPLVLIHPLLPLYESYQLLLLWAISGELERAQNLAAKLWPLRTLSTLWVKEGSYEEAQSKISHALMEKAYGKEGVLFEEKSTPFLTALAKKNVHLGVCPPQEHQIVYPELGFSFHKTHLFTAAYTLSGNKTSLGVFHTEKAEVRAFGPQLFPLNFSENFGILREPDSQPLERWTALAADPEVWMEVHADWEEKGALFQLRFLGLKPEKKLSFCFYVKAKSCQIGSEAIAPRTLKRFKGSAQPVSFGGNLLIESLIPAPMELIPLAGSGGFWNADYLLAFDIPPFEAKGEFRLHLS